jgi:hypothetical protein
MLFSKKIDTKKDHLAEMKTSIRAAIDAALKAGVPSSLICNDLSNRATDFQRREEFLLEQRRANPTPHFTKADYEKRARDEERRIAEELARQQREYREAVNERGRAEARRRGEIL